MLSKRRSVTRVIALGFALLVVALIASSSAHAGRQTVGTFINEPGAYDGFTLFSGLRGDNAYLIDNEGRLVHWWANVGGRTPYLLEDGSIVVGPVRTDGVDWVRRFAWDGTLLWDFEYVVPGTVVHHDIEVLPNGNVMIIARDFMTGAQAIAAGRDLDLLLDNGLQPLHLIEVMPTGPTSGDIVWEWRAWDHLIQDFDATKSNYGVIADHPELVDVNFIEFSRPPEGEADWHHTNSVDYNEEFDQLVVSLRHFSEVWVIDHSTTTEQAALHSGGNSGNGGDLLFRWGNPQAYGAGDAADQQLFGQHDARWIEAGLPGEENILIFNNGNGRPGPFSSVVEITPPVDSSGNYSITPGTAFEPASPAWEYISTFYAFAISGAERLPNGNTLVNNGPQGTFFQVTPSGDIVWQYTSPVTSNGPLVQGQFDLWQNNVFKAGAYSRDYLAFVGQDLSPGATLETDSDGDGLADLAEIALYGTDPFREDTDEDGLSDGDEVNVYMTSPLSSDTDNDGMSDAYEVANDCLDATTDDANNDTDTDLLLNSEEFMHGSDPCSADTDGDGLTDGEEIIVYGTNPTLADTDGDGVSDGDEVLIFGTDPTRAARLGDVNCSDEVSSIDAALILQLTAGLVDGLPCEEAADVNDDGITSSIDAAIILQFSAGLLPRL